MLAFPLYLGQRVGSGRSAQALVVHVGIDLGGVQMLVTEHLLKGAYIHAVFQHQCGCGVTQLMAGIEGAVQTRF